MDWTQTFTIIGSITASMVAVWYAFYTITDKRIDRMEEHHREDIQIINDNLQKIDLKWDEAIQRMDSKWERLFERLLLQDQQKNKS
jgi:hypothetical protein